MEIILSICINWLTDSVFAIREATCKLMKKLYEIFKGEEFEKKLLVKLNEMFVNNNYLIRNTLVLLVKVSIKLLTVLIRNSLMKNIILNL